LETQQIQKRRCFAKFWRHHFTAAGMIDQINLHWLSAGLRSQEQLLNIEASSHFTAGLDFVGTLRNRRSATTVSSYFSTH